MDVKRIPPIEKDKQADMDLVGPYYALAALYQRRCSLRLSNNNITIPIRGRDYITPIFLSL